MSNTSFTAPNLDDQNHDTSAANITTKGIESSTSVRYQLVLDLLNSTPKFTDEWFRLKEEEVNLRSHLDFHESSFTDLVGDSNKLVAGEEVDDLLVEKSNVEKISTLDSNQNSVKQVIGRPHTDHSARDLSISQQAAKIGADRPKDDNFDVIASDPPVLSSSTSTAKKSYLRNDKKTRQAIKLNNARPPSAHEPPSRDFNAELEYRCSNAGISNEAAIAMGSKYCDKPPTPFSLCSHTFFDGEKSKENPTLETLVDAVTAVKSEDSASSTTQSPLAAGSSYMNQGQLFLNDDVVQQSFMRPVVAVNYGQFSPPPVSETDSIHPRASADVLSQAGPNESVLEEEVREDVIEIPEAFLVDENAPEDNPHVGVAELVEPDRNTLLLKKRHACLISILFTAIVITFGVTFYFRRSKPPSNVTSETTVIFPPSQKPTLLPLSSQPSFLQPSLSIKYAIEKNVLQRNLIFDGMEDTNARVLALDWINNKDPMELDASASNLFQRYILVLLDYESNIGWLSDVNPNDTECKWLGVVCDKDGNVIELELNDNSLKGTMTPEIGSLQFLRILSMEGNYITGTLPYELGNLKDLSELYLSANNFTGTLPSEMSNLKNLTALNLGTNEFTGTVPLGIWSLDELISLSLASNQFIGTLPSEVGGLIQLTELDLRGNSFYGAIPPELGNLSKLAELDLYNNQLSGTLPSELGYLSNLTKLDLSNNNFMGTLPSDLGNLNRLTTLDIANNELTGTVPSEFGNLKKLTLFWLHANKFTGTLPSELGNLEEMTDLMASDNGFNGTLPTEIGNLKELRSVKAYYNLFTGSLPTQLGRSKMLEELDLSSNMFVGSIPSEIGQLTSLTLLSIDSNRFTGKLPSQVGELTELYQLYIGGNQFTGTLPSELGHLKKLTYLGIEENKFNGTLPSWIGDLRTLTDIRLNKNQFTGPFPSEIGNILDLSRLWLNDNQFTGTFPPEIENTLNLMSFCLSSNNFTGSLPAEIQLTYDCEY
ncbi:hypothetical protein ACHAW6_005450 [Cyclotella cf. meneghiniana]